MVTPERRPCISVELDIEVGEHEDTSVAEAITTRPAVKLEISRTHSSDNITRLEYCPAFPYYHILNRYDLHNMGHTHPDSQDPTDCSRQGSLRRAFLRQ
jgi:hypothetical protein